MKTIFENIWACLVFEACPYKADILPRITVSNYHSCGIIINFGWLWFDFNLSLWGKEMREFNKRNNDSLR